jgi:hypothetical protein
VVGAGRLSVLWSILIAAIPERFHSAQPLLYSLLEKQAVSRLPDVEFLYLMDNRRWPVGTKRNALLGMATGDYVSFIDDDDEVAADYVRRIYSMLQLGSKVDVLCFGQRATLQPHNVIHECSYSLQHFKRDPRRQLAQIVGEDGKPLPDRLAWSGPPAHTMVWRREIVKDLRFPEKTFGEDVSWVDQACERAKSEIQIPGEPLYFYKFNEATSATR